LSLASLISNALISSSLLRPRPVSLNVGDDAVECVTSFRTAALAILAHPKLLARRPIFIGRWADTCDTNTATDAGGRAGAMCVRKCRD